LRRVGPAVAGSRSRVHVAFIGVCSVRDALISGALVIQSGCGGRLVSTAWPPVWGLGSGKLVVVVVAGLGTLLGPEGTGRLAWSPLWWWLRVCPWWGGVCFFWCGAGLLPYRSGVLLGLPCWVGLCAGLRVFGGGWGRLLFVVCELHSGREHLCGQVF
jgi:hypothetical protein